MTVAPLDLDAGALIERLDDEIAQQQGFVMGPLSPGLDVPLVFLARQ